jgi:hypothetical protein
MFATDEIFRLYSNRTHASLQSSRMSVLRPKMERVTARTAQSSTGGRPLAANRPEKGTRRDHHPLWQQEVLVGCVGSPFTCLWKQQLWIGDKATEETEAPCRSTSLAVKNPPKCNSGGAGRPLLLGRRNSTTITTAAAAAVARRTTSRRLPPITHWEDTIRETMRQDL